MKTQIGLRPGDLKKIQRLDEWPPVLQDNVHKAIQTSLGYDGLQKTALNYMERRFKTTRGRSPSLLDSFSTSVISDGKGVLGTLSNTAPHAWRREEGFSGRTDSLGRHFKKDPGIHYMRYALKTEKDKIVERVKEAVQESLKQI